MSEKTIDLLVPDIGDFSDVDVIEVYVAVGDVVAVEDALIALETDKAAMDVPATDAGVIVRLNVQAGDTVSEGSVIATLRVADEPASDTDDDTPGHTVQRPALQPNSVDDSAAMDSGGSESTPAQETASADKTDAAGKADKQADLVVLGAGPGGYAAAFRAADLGLKVVLIERWPTLGGVCLNVGCIPSKALLHAARVIEEADAMAAHGIDFGEPDIDAVKLRDWKDSIVKRLTDGLATIAKKRKVEVVHGEGRFVSAHRINVTTSDGELLIGFAQCIIAAGSESAPLPGVSTKDPRIVDSTGALELAPLPDNLLVVGGGIIGLEMACVYDALGVDVSVVELTDTLMPGTDADLVKPLKRRLERRYRAIMLGVKVTGIEPGDGGVEVRFEGEGAPTTQHFERVLVAIGRQPNGKCIDAARAGVSVDERGFIAVDKQMRTSVAHIFAIGDIVGQPMLAHKATHQGHVAAEVAAGNKRAFDARVIPSVAYTDPEIAWVGMTEAEAKSGALEFGVGRFPWAASGRSLAIGRDEGFTKILFELDSGRVLGAGIVGTNAGDLISELALAIEMSADAADIALTIHPHPTLSETVGLAAEAFEGTITDLYLPKKRN